VRAEPDSALRASEYRQTVIRCGDHERAAAFFAALAAARPSSANLALNHGLALVDAIPTAGAIGRVLLADRAVEQFSRAIDLEASWLALFTRGNAYLYWPKVFGRLPLAVADLERAAALARSGEPRTYMARGWVALGDAYWKAARPERALETWREGLALFPGNPRLAARLAAEGEALAALIESELDPAKRVDTDLSVMEPTR
jgi:tetratricopeptide (TPR) repeat protein